MKKKQVMALLLATVMAASTLFTGCGSETKKDSPEQGSSGDTGNEEVVTITYGGFDSNLFMQEMAAKFNETHSDIKVEVKNILEVNGSWGNERLAELAATGELPDIVNVQNLVMPVQNDWLVDLMPYYEKDKDAAQLPANFVEYGTVDGKLLMLPSAMYLYGVMVNKDVLTANGIEIPDYNWTVDEFMDIIKKTTRTGSTIGTNGVEELLQYLPAEFNPALSGSGFNTEEKHYDLGEDWQKSVEIVKEVIDNGWSFYEAIDAIGIPWEFDPNSEEYKQVDEARAQYTQDLVGETVPDMIWYKGKAATWCVGSWTMGFAENENYSGFDWDYYPVPSGSKDTDPRTSIIVDFLGVTSSCEHPEAAYEFVKFLSFASEGIETRMDLVENYDKEALMAKYPDNPESDFATPFQYTQMPVTTDKELIQKWADFAGVKPGVTYMLERLEDGFCESYKIVPGYDQAFTETILGAVKSQIFTGEKTAADLAAELEQKANEITDKAYESLGK